MAFVINAQSTCRLCWRGHLEQERIRFSKIGKMMIKHFLIVIGLFWFVFLPGCSANPNEKANGLYAEASASQNPLACALFLAETSDEDKSFIWAEIAGKYVEAGLFAQAMKIAETADDLHKSAILAVIAGKYAEIGHDKAIVTAQIIEKPFYKACAFTEVAGWWIDSGQTESAIKILSQAFEITKTIEDRTEASKAQAKIASQYAKADRFGQAIIITKAIKVPICKADALVEIAGWYAETRQKEIAARLLSQAIETITLGLPKPSASASVQARLLAKIAVKYAEIGQQPSERDKANLRKIVDAARLVVHFSNNVG